MRTRESAQIHTRHDGERSIQHEYCDPYTRRPIPIGGSILLAGVRHKDDLEAPTAVMSADGFKDLLYYYNSMNETPELPKTDVKLDFACRVADDGTYGYANGAIKDVVWPESKHGIERPLPELARDFLYHPAIGGTPQAFELEPTYTAPQSMQWLSPKHDTANEFDHDWATHEYEVPQPLILWPSLRLTPWLP